MRLKNYRFDRLALCALLIGLQGVCQADDGSPETTKVYGNDFSEKYDEAHWPTMKLVRRPGGDGHLSPKSWCPQFLHDKLPPHEYLRVRLKVVLFGSVEGCLVDGPPDYWAVMEGARQVLLRTTFQNTGKDKRGVADGFGQAFPDEYPMALNPSQTGGKARDGENTVYDFDLVFPHTSESLSLQFQFTFNDRDRESWYIDGLELEVISGSARRTDEELEALWKKLISKDAVAAFNASNELIASGRPGIAFVDEQWKAYRKKNMKAAKKPAVVAAEIDKMVLKLDSDKFIDRLSARKDLIELGVAAVPQIEKFLASKPSPDVKASLTKVLASLRKNVKRPGGENYQKRLVASRVARFQRIAGVTNRWITQVTGSSSTGIAALLDGFGGDAVAGTNAAPKYVWWKAREGKEGWVQYDFDRERVFDSADVFWAQNLQAKSGPRLPQSWSLSYLDGGKWVPVKPKGEYGISSNQFNHIEFEPIRTKSIKLTAKSDPDASRTAVFEFKVNQASELKE